MPRDKDKDNDSRGRRDRPPGQGPLRRRTRAGEEIRQARVRSKSDGGKRDGERRPYAGKRDGDAPRPRDDRPLGDRPPRFSRDDRPRGERCVRRPAVARWRREAPVQAARGPSELSRRPRRRQAPLYAARRPATIPIAAAPVRARAFLRQEIRRQEALYAARPRWREAALHATRRGLSKGGDRPQGDRPYRARPPRDGDRPPRGDRPERKFDGERKFSRGAPDGAHARILAIGRRAANPSHGRSAKAAIVPIALRARGLDKPRFDRPRDDRGGDERPRFSRAREDRVQGDRPRGDRPRDSPQRRPAIPRSYRSSIAEIARNLTARRDGIATATLGS